MKTIQKIKKGLTTKIITKNTLAKVKGGTRNTIINPDEISIG